jgi:hypothetical protein
LNQINLPAGIAVLLKLCVIELFITQFTVDATGFTVTTTF